MSVNKEMIFYPAGVVTNLLDTKEVEFWGHDGGEFAPAEGKPSQDSVTEVNQSTPSPGK